MYDYKLLQALSAVINEGGFEKGSLKLFISQSAISQRIKTLEDEVGAVLITRTNPPKPTDAGKILLTHFNRVLQLEEDVEKEMGHGHKEYSTIPVGINADSLETWFMDTINDFIKKNDVLLDLKVDDQDQTKKMLKNGEVQGCISSDPSPIQGCTVKTVGVLNYFLLSTPEYKEKWFPNGVTKESAEIAPIVIFSKFDELHYNYFKKILGFSPQFKNIHYLPSVNGFVDFILNSHACGMLPDIQSSRLIEQGKMVKIIADTHLSVTHYWHSWNIESKILRKLGETICKGGKKRLK